MPFQQVYPYERTLGSPFGSYVTIGPNYIYLPSHISKRFSTKKVKLEVDIDRLAVRITEASTDSPDAYSVYIGHNNHTVGCRLHLPTGKYLEVEPNIFVKAEMEVTWKK